MKLSPKTETGLSKDRVKQKKHRTLLVYLASATTAASPTDAFLDVCLVLHVKTGCFARDEVGHSFLQRRMPRRVGEAQIETCHVVGKARNNCEGEVTRLFLLAALAEADMDAQDSKTEPESQKLEER